MSYDILFSSDSPDINDSDVACIRSTITKTLDYLKYHDRKMQVSVLFTTPEIIKQINLQYRNVDRATNVLSFPNQHDILGDVVLCYDVIKDEADIQGKSFKDHLTHLVVHSLLHLIGYDHVSDEQAQKMEEREIEILKNVFSIRNPYL